MRIVAKYRTRCAKCGNRVEKGEVIEWEPRQIGMPYDRLASHIVCPPDSFVRTMRDDQKTVVYLAVVIGVPLLIGLIALIHHFTTT